MVTAAGELEQWDPEQAECMLMEGGSMVLSFGTTWCGPCAMLAPELATTATAMEDYDTIAVAKVRVCVAFPLFFPFFSSLLLSTTI